MSIMYASVKRLYDEGRLTETGLDNAVAKGWITSVEKTQFMEE